MLHNIKYEGFHCLQDEVKFIEINHTVGSKKLKRVNVLIFTSER